MEHGFNSVWSVHLVAGTAPLCESRDSDGKWEDTSSDEHYYGFASLLLDFYMDPYLIIVTTGTTDGGVLFSSRRTVSTENPKGAALSNVHPENINPQHKHKT